MQLTVHPLLTEQFSCRIKRKLNVICFDTQRQAFSSRCARQAGKLPAVVTLVMVPGIAGCPEGQQAAAVIAELLNTPGNAAIVVRSAAFQQGDEQSPFVPFHLPGCVVRANLI